MINTGFEQRVKINQIIDNQLPEFILDESPKASEFLKQYYISQEFSSGPVDIVDNLDNYRNLDILTKEVLKGETLLENDITSSSTTIVVSSTKGYPKQYGLLQIDDEVITYTGITTNTFINCVRGFSGITSYHSSNDQEELVFSKNEAKSHTKGSTVKNLSSLFLREFNKKLKYLLTPGLEDYDFINELNVGSFVKNAKDFYAAKGTEESYRILFQILYGVNPKVIDLERFLIKPSSAEYIRREVLLIEVISGDPNKLVGQTVFDSTDPFITGSVSEVELIQRFGKYYYKLSLFVGYNDKSLISGSFNITPKTKVIENTIKNSSVIIVDSTIGFEESGTLICGDNKITYKNKTINQFLECSGIKNNIKPTTDIRSNKFIYGYENGDITKKVVLLLDGVISNLNIISDSGLSQEGEKIYLKNIGEIIDNPEKNKSYKEIFSNSWIYNTSCRFQIESINGTTFELKSLFDKSNLKVDDRVDILFRNSETIAYENAIVSSISSQLRQLTLDNISEFFPNPSFEYDIRRKINKASSSSVLFKYGYDNIVSDIQNLYNQNDEYAYVASNSFPSNTIDDKLTSASLIDASGSRIQGFNYDTLKYSILSFNENVPFITGDEIYYKPEKNSILGLQEGIYYVEVLTNKNQIRLYVSRSFIPINDYLEFSPLTANSGSHTFILSSQKNIYFEPQKLLRKFNFTEQKPSESNFEDFTKIGPTGMLVNGVEIYNYKSNNRIYYGPISKFKIFNAGSGYDVLNPPKIEISLSNSGIGTAALVQPVISGSLVEVIVDPQDFDIRGVLSASIVGGNGSGSVLQPILDTQYREIVFDAREISIGGGIDVNDETISFVSNHNLIKGEPIVYDSNKNNSIGIGSYKASNLNQLKYLVEGGIYYPEIINNTSVKLYQNLTDLNSGINTVGFTTINNSGFHKFRLLDGKTTLTELKVIESGSGYENRKLIVDPSGIKTDSSLITFKNHNFSDGELVNYSSTGNPISGLSTYNQYYILKVDEDNFRLSKTDRVYLNFYTSVGSASTPSQQIFIPDHNFEHNQKIIFNKNSSIDPISVRNTLSSQIFSLPLNGNEQQILYIVKKSKDYIGISTVPVGSAGTGLFICDLGSNSNEYYFDLEENQYNKSLDYQRRKYLKFTDNGSEKHIFEYPPISVSLNYFPIGVGTDKKLINSIKTTPVIKGSIIDAYLYEPGSGYGSDILNLHVKPKISIKNGSNCQLKPIIVNGKIIKVLVQSKGNSYNSPPDLNIVGDGFGAKLRSIVENGKVINVVVIRSGNGYTTKKTYIQVNSRGSGAIFDADVRYLTINNASRFGDRLLINTDNGLEYSWVGYSTALSSSIFGDSSKKHSPIIGWSYDGNPIYGPYGYSDPYSTISPITPLRPGYKPLKNLVVDRPEFPEGFFIEDYYFDNSGDLDYSNGRFGVTPDFPEGIYAYFAGIGTNSSNELVSQFPYFIGEKYRSNVIEQNFNQSFDFNSSNLIRNTFPYKINDSSAKYDFIEDSIQDINQYKHSAVIESTKKGGVTSFDIIDSGQNYKVNDTVIFDNSKTMGAGAFANVASIVGKDLIKLETNLDYRENVVFEWKNSSVINGKFIPEDYFEDKTRLVVSGLSTYIKGLDDSFQIGINTESHALLENVSPNVIISGIVTDISLTQIPNFVSVGSTIQINDEKMRVLNIFANDSVLRVKRSYNTNSYERGDRVVLNSNIFQINLRTDYFESKINKKIYFNPKYSVGVGTISGITSSISYSVGKLDKNIDVPTRSIYLPDHPFETNQRVTLYIPSPGSPLSASNTSGGSLFSIPSSGTKQDVYIIKKTKDFIGIVTSVGLTTTSDGVFFADSASDNFEYYFESKYKNVTGKISNISTLVSVSTYHSLSANDEITLSVTPKKSIGIGSSEEINLKFDNTNNQILINSIGFNSTSVSSAENSIEIFNHGFKTEEKVFYSTPPNNLSLSGLSTGNYFIYKIDENNISLCHTLIDVKSDPPKFIGISSLNCGTTHYIEKISPKINIFRNNNIVFNVSDSSLSGYELKFYSDSNFYNEFVSIANTGQSAVSGVGTIGISSDAKLTLKYTSDTPENLFYTLEKNGVKVSQDSDVIDSLTIVFDPSNYNGEYKVSAIGLGSTTFRIDLSKIPEFLTYISSDDVDINYTTKSKTAKGGIDKLKLHSKGFNYKKLPIINRYYTDTGENAKIIPKSNDIGKINSIKIVDPSYNFSIDKTIRPEAFLSPNITIKDFDTITKVDVKFGGSNYTSAPDLILIDSQTRDIISSGSLKCNVLNSSIKNVEILDNPKGLIPGKHEIYTVNNSNGINVNTVSYSNGTVTCELLTPIDGFRSSPFSIGDKIFVEGIVGISSVPGSGFNSKNYGYQFFKVKNYLNTVPAVLEYSLVGFTTNPGDPIYNQSSYSSITNYKNYPEFEITQGISKFTSNEKLLVKERLNGPYIEKDLYVLENTDNLLRIYGKSNLLNGQKVKGFISGSEATIFDVAGYKLRFNIDYAADQEMGWSSDIGFLNSDYQVLPDNDYYQNLSYTIKSPIPYEKLITPVNSLLHTTGLKNFADLEIISQSKTSFTSGDSQSAPLIDIISEKRTDDISNYDLSVDYDVTDNISKFIRFKNRRLTDYIECKTNRVLKIDDISNKFSNKEDVRNDYADIYEFYPNEGYSRFLIQIRNPNENPIYANQTQISEVVVLTDSENIFTLEKTHLSNAPSSLGTFDGDFSGETATLRFFPRDPIKEDYDIKVLRTSYTTTLPGISTYNLGSINLTSVINSVGIGTTVTLISQNINNVKSHHLSVEVIDSVSKESTFTELYLSNDGTNPVTSEYFFDTSEFTSSSGYIGSFSSYIQSNVLTLNYTNNSDNSVLIRANIVGFANTSNGVGTFRYAQNDQLPDTEKTAKIVSHNSLTSSGSNEIVRFNRFDFSSSKSLVRIGLGNTNAIHQVMLINDGNQIYTKQYPILSIGSTTGIGTFGAIVDGTDLVLKFYPDVNKTYESISLNELFYQDLDFLSGFNNLRYGSIQQNFSISEYSGSQGIRASRDFFDMRSNGVPIFRKIFNPSNQSILFKETGILAIKDHFFNTGEELVYTPKSTFLGVGTSRIGIPTTLVGGVDFSGDFIVGFSTITGIGNTSGIEVGQILRGTNINSSTTVTGIGSTFIYFAGNTSGSKNILSIGNTSLLRLNDSVFSYQSLSGFGTITSIGINSITVENNVSAGIGSTYFVNRNEFSITISQVSSASTYRQNYSVGLTTTLLPSKVYAIKISNDILRLSTRKEDALSGIYVTFTNTGEGNAHQLEMKKKNEKAIIALDGILQSPLAYTPLSYQLTGNPDGKVSIGNSYISLSGISSFKPSDTLKVNQEYMKVISVGFATSNNGPISGIGTTALIYVQRGYFGSTESEHNDLSIIRLYSGSYNIAENSIYFGGIPRGSSGSSQFDESNLKRIKTSFNGRVYLRQDYSTNVIYDDISYSFTGIGRTYTLSTNGENVTGTRIGDGILLVNQIYQTPTTQNNSNNNYEFIETVGITSVIFSGIEDPVTDEKIISPSDINQNNLPRGGIIVSLGSTNGLGYAPLVGIKTSMIKVQTGSGGSITSIGFNNSPGINTVFGSGYNGLVSIGITDFGGTGSGSIITANVGAGGSLSKFNIINGGSNYTKPVAVIPDPSYENLPVVGVSRLGVGATTETGTGLLITLSVEASSSSVGIGTTLFEVSSFKISRPGYGFKIGDVVKPVGLVTDSRLTSPIRDCEFTVLDVFYDSFSSWQFGELDYIDDIKNLQDGMRRQFPLYKNGSLLSFEINVDDANSSVIDLNYVLLIFVNGIIQDPYINYNFQGGSVFTFTESPGPEDKVSIYFYRGSSIDSSVVNVRESIKKGDSVRVESIYVDNIGLKVQDSRTIFSISGSDIIETDFYSGVGIDEETYRPISWSKQKVDKVVNGDYIYKIRDSLESQIYPTAKIIKSFTNSDNQIFVDDARLFQYEDDFLNLPSFGGIILSSEQEVVAAAATAIVSMAGTISNISITNYGSGYTQNQVSIKVSSPASVGVGVGTTAYGTAVVSNGQINSTVSMNNYGFGYNPSKPPYVIVESPAIIKENISRIASVQGFSGIITGISTSVGTGGNPLAIKFYLNSNGNFNTLSVGYPLLISDTQIGIGITSIDSNNSNLVGIGTTYMNNIYYVHDISYIGSNAVITSNIHSSTSIIGLSSTGSIQKPLGKFSWGRLYGFSSRISPISISLGGYTINSGLSTFPVIQRRNYGLRDNGSLRDKFD
jgi:hypothetical protein